MVFRYDDYQSNNVNNNISIGTTWDNKKTNNPLLNSIFKYIDDGNKVVSEEEYWKLHRITENLSTNNNDEDAQLLKDLNNNKDLFIAIKLSQGDFKILENMEDDSIDIIKIVQYYSEITDGKSIRANILEQCFSGEITNDEALERYNAINILQYDYENNHRKINRYFYNRNKLLNVNPLTTDDLGKYFQKINLLNTYLENNPNLREEINNFQNKFKEEYGFEITDYGIMKAQEAKFINLDNLDFEAFKNDPNIEDILYNIKNLRFNINEESLLRDANFEDKSLERYSYNIYKSEIGSLLLESQNIQFENFNYTVDNDPDSGICKITNKKTGEIRTIDLNQLSTDLTEQQKRIFKRAFDGMNNIMKWEFSQEVLGLTDVKSIDASGQYYINEDKIGIAYDTDSYALSHEIIHAMMATVINGKNTFNEELNTQLLETFEREKAIFLEKENLNHEGSILSDYQYVAQNIHEFAAESGCLHLLGTSASEYTIAKYFPESYKIVIKMIDNIRVQKENRILPKETT